MSSALKKELPAFATEAEEAQWWFDNREEIGDEFVEAMKDGRATRGAMLRCEIVRSFTVDLSAEEIAFTRKLADKKGMEYKDCLQWLLRAALDREMKLIGPIVAHE